MSIVVHYGKFNLRHDNGGDDTTARILPLIATWSGYAARRLARVTRARALGGLMLTALRPAGHLRGKVPNAPKIRKHNRVGMSATPRPSNRIGENHGGIIVLWIWIFQNCILDSAYSRISAIEGKGRSATTRYASDCDCSLSARVHSSTDPPRIRPLLGLI
jgi:hypothetical protein